MAYDVAKAFKRIEDELIDSMMRNLGRHNAEEALEGFDWTQWQVEQLRSLEEYRKNNQEKYGPEFKKINERIGKSIEQMGAKGENEQEKEILRAIDKGHVPPIKREGNLEGTFFGVNNRKLDALLDATQNDFQRAEIAVLRRADDQYRRIIFDAQFYANTGAATYGKAIDMATKDFLMRGIDCIEYKNGARHTISDYADMYVKTAQTRAYLAGEGKMREEWGEHYVIVNKRGDVTCPKCAKWVGRVLIDDVYSGGKPDGKTPLLSTAMADGFLHPRCKDIFTTYFPGISTPPEPATKKEIRQAERAEKAEARQNTAELMQEKWERRAKYQMDPANKRMCVVRTEQWKEQLAQKAFDLKAEKISSDIALPAGFGYPTPGRKISKKQLRVFVEKAESVGVKLDNSLGKYGGFEEYCGDISVLHAMIDDIIDSKKYWGDRNQSMPVILRYKSFGNLDDFADTYKGVISLNKDLFDDSDYMKRLYIYLTEHGTEEEYRWFVKGTDYRSVILHELGHRLNAYDSRLYSRVRDAALSYSSTVEEFCLKNLSEYAMMHSRGRYTELLSELMSALYSNDKATRDLAHKIIMEAIE